MKNLRLFATVMFCTLIFASNVFSQEGEKSLAERLKLVEKQNSAFNFYLNMQSRGDILLEDGNFTQALFRNHQLRLEMRGSIVDGVTYRLRHRLNKSNAGQNLDGISKATDIASVTVRALPGFHITLGKQCAAYGGYEFDLNPIDIYEYSDMIEYMDNFLAGIDFNYVIGKQEFRFQILDSRSSKFQNVYADYANSAGAVKGNDGEYYLNSKVPFLYTLNWNGDILDGTIKTRWSYTYGVDADDTYMRYVALGTQVLITEDIQLQADWMNSNEDVDRKGIMTSMIDNGMVATDAKYNSFVAKIDMRANKDWNFFVKGMYETATADGLEDEARVALGFMGGVEYSPFADNIKFFANYSRRDYSFEMVSYGTDYDTDRFSIGLVYRLKMF